MGAAAGGAPASGGAAGGSAGHGGAGGAAAALVCPKCGKGMTCAFRITDGCSAVGTCVNIPVPSPCWAIISAIACGCDGRTVEWENGCMPDLPDGYAPTPVVHTGLCP